MSREKLGQRMRLRRRELGLTQEAVRTLGGPGLVTQRLLEKGRYDHDLGAKVITGIEQSLGWEAGSVESVLAGGEPTVSPPPEAPDPITTANPEEVGARVSGDAGAAPLGDQFGLVHEVLAMRGSFAQMTAGWPEETRATLRDQVEKFSRTAENTLIAALTWLRDEDRGDAYRLLLQLREPL